MSSVGIFKTQRTDELLVSPTVNPQQSVVPNADVAAIVRANNNYCVLFSGVVIETMTRVEARAEFWTDLQSVWFL